MSLTPEQIRTKGLAVLRRELGPSGMIRFLQQFENGKGDYVKDRRKWLDKLTMDDLRKAAGLKPKRKRK